MAGVPGPGGSDSSIGGDYTGTGGTGGTDNRARINQWYQQYLGRPATDEEANGWLRDHPDLVGVEDGIKGSDEAKLYAGGKTTVAPGGGSDHAAQIARVNQWYQQYMGRPAGDQEAMDWIYGHPDLAGVEYGIQNSAEAKTYATAHPAGGAPAGGAGGTGGGSPAWTYGDDAQAAWMAWPGAGTVANVKTFADAWNKAHPNDLVSLGGSKGEKLTWRGKTYDTVISAGTGGAGKSWGDVSAGGGGGAAGGTGIDQSYLDSYPGGQFQADENANLPGKFTYDDFQKPDAQAMLDDPSYQFRRDEAMGAIANSASGRGLTNSGGTLHDLLGAASQFASQEYGNIWDRDFSEWQGKYNTALGTWTANKGLGEDYYNREKTSFDQSVKDYYDQRDAAWDKQYKMAALGAGVTTSA